MVGTGGPSDRGGAVDKLLADPLIQLVMRADRVESAQIRRLLHDLHSRCGSIDLGADKPAVFPHEDPDYRLGVGIMLLNPDGRVFVGCRIRDPGDAWQMPQGGIEPDEAPLDAAMRELREETGTDKVELLAESDGWLRYDLPEDLLGKAWQGRWRGQQQKWFAMRFLGSDAEIDIATEHPEFSAWRWAEITELPQLIVSFKRQLYASVLEQFQGVQPSTAESPEAIK